MNKSFKNRVLRVMENTLQAAGSLVLNDEFVCIEGIITVRRNSDGEVIHRIYNQLISKPDARANSPAILGAMTRENADQYE